MRRQSARPGVRGRRSAMRLMVVAVLAPACLVAGQMEVTASAGKAAVNVVRRVDLDYHLLTRERPIEFRVEGPDWLRVYTRLWWPPGAQGSQTYRMSLWQEGVERPLEFETAESKSSFGPGRRRVARWRSFYVQVPEGTASYRLVLDDAATDTVGIRFSFQRPRSWSGVMLGGLAELLLVQGADTVSLYRLATGHSAEFAVSGPCRLRVRCLLGFDPTMVGAQNFVLSAYEGEDELAVQNFRVSRSGSSYANEPGVVPGDEKSLRFNLSEGTHRLKLKVDGTLAQSAGVRVERLANEKYE